MKKSGIIISIIASIGIITAFSAAGYYFYKAKKAPRTVSVVGLAEKDFTSDLIVWDFSYGVKRTDMKEAYNAIKSQNETVKAYLIAKGIDDKIIVFNAIDNYADYNYEWNEQTRHSVQIFNGYQLTQKVRIESKEVEKVEKISREISELLDKNIQINDNHLAYYYTKLADLKIEMLEQATLDAKKRAETIAKNAGSGLAGLKTANMGVFQITAPNSGDDYSWGGAFNTSSKEKRASINMRLTYYVK